jgi:hypothetical protein
MSKRERTYAVRIAVILLLALLLAGLAFYTVFSILTMPSIEYTLLTPQP